ncbi:nucleobase:cation symporter-1, NCS1 family, partial [Phenoliferia sp. Uapishka_3]
MAWCIKKASGGGELLHAGPTVHGEAFASAWLLSMTSLIGGYATVALNIPDFTRYAKSPMSQYIQAPILPALYLITALFGIISASCTKSFHGTVLWSPLACFSFKSDPLTNTEPPFSAANDLSTLFPRYINIKRGQLICAIIGGWAMVPWKVLSSAKTFLNFISSYAIILAPLTGIMCADFYLVKKQNFDVPGLYDPRGAYRYFGGTNWRAVVTLIVSVGPNFPGMINVLHPSTSIGNIKWIYSVSWLFGFIVSGVVYTALSKAFPDTTGSIVQETTYAEDARQGSHIRKSSGSLDMDYEEEKAGEEKDSGVVVSAVMVA